MKGICGYFKVKSVSHSSYYGERGEMMKCAVCNGLGYFEVETGVVSPHIPYTKEIVKEGCDDCNATGDMTDQQIIETLATKVMGWTTKSETSLFWLDTDGQLRPKHNWNPTQNIADAWQVVEKLMERDLLFNLAAAEDGWRATFKRVDKTFIDTKEWDWLDETAPKAISMAAYKLVA